MGPKRHAPDSLPLQLRKHLLSCTSNACACRRVVFNLKTWEKNFTIVTSNVQEILDQQPAEAAAHDKARSMENQVWYQLGVSRENNAEFRVRCVVCDTLAGKGWQFVSPAQCRLGHLRRHQESNVHMAAVLKMLGAKNPELLLRRRAQRGAKTPVKDKDSTLGRPTAQDFAKVLQAVQQGRPDGVPGVAARSKARKLQFCVFEAMREHWREQLRGAASISLLRDERHKRLLLRFRCSNLDLQVTEGTFGQLKCNYSSSALGLAEATWRLLREFCTPGSLDARPAAPPMDSDLFEHIRLHIHSTTVDSASNEVTCAQDMAAVLEADLGGLSKGERLLPQHKLIIRDRAHAARRTLSRPWHADVYLDTVVQSMTTGAHSIGQLIQRSDDFRAWYAEATERSSSKTCSSSFRNLRAALHRYETLVTPLSRIALDPESIVSTAARIAEQRVGQHPGRVALQFLQAVNPEMLLSVALLADAGDEALQVVRVFDAAQPDPAMASRTFKDFVMRVQGLFLDEQVLTTPGHTQAMLDWLSTPHVFNIGMEVRSLGGPFAMPQLVLRRCLGRLKAWVVLCQEAASAKNWCHNCPLANIVTPPCLPLPAAAGARGGIP